MSQLSDPDAQEVSEGNKYDKGWEWDKSFEIWERALNGAHCNRKGVIARSVLVSSLVTSLYPPYKLY